MDVYILDSSLKRETLLENFESFIWTERWQSLGDFELKISATRETKALLDLERFLSIDGSNRLMMIEYIEEGFNDDGRKTLNVKGRSLELMLENRVAIKKTDPGADWTFNSGDPTNIAASMVARMMRDPSSVLTSHDILPFLQIGSWTPNSNGDIYEGSFVNGWAQPPATLLSAIQSISSDFNLGFRLVNPHNKSELYFESYRGSNRARDFNIEVQNEYLPLVSFDERLDRFILETRIRSIQNFKNVAYVVGVNADAYYHRDEEPWRTGEPGYVKPTVAGFARRAMLVNGSDAESSSFPGFWAAVQAMHPRTKANIIDGEVGRESPYIYGTDYRLGDVVLAVDEDGNRASKRVVEYIFVSDNVGDRGYPTLADYEPVLRPPPDWNPQ